MTAQPRHIECVFPRRGVTAVIELLTAEAPATSQALWERLPIETDSYHSKWNGHEMFVVLPSFPGLTAENLAGDIQPGDVVLFHFDATYRAAPRHLRAAGLGDYAELGFYYGSLARACGPVGQITGTRLGRIVEGLEPLREAVQAMRRTGFEAMTIRRRV
jgi:uncharacterized protein DUF3830